MKHPSHRFIKFLLLENKNVEEELQKYDLPKVKDLSFFNLEKPEEFQPRNKEHKESQDFLKKEKIQGLYFPDKYLNEAYDILIDFSVREVIEKLLISKLPGKDIAIKINSRWDKSLSGEGIEAFKHYFWDASCMRVKDWIDTYRDSSERSRIKTILRHGSPYALQVMGFIDKIEAKEALRKILNICSRCTDELSDQEPTPEMVKSLALLAQTIDKIDDKLSSGGESNKEVLGRFERLQIEHLPNQIIGIGTTAPIGNFTGGKDPALLMQSTIIEYRELPKEEILID